MRVLVCGGRDFGSRRHLYLTLDEIHAEKTFSLLINGGAQGADFYAKLWAIENDIPVQLFLPEWRKYGRSAGIIRNRQMLDEGRPELVIAFPGGRGTGSMVTLAKLGNVPVIEVPHVTKTRAEHPIPRHGRPTER